jgi:asparagine synthase (glutamine-hydrolysing)
MCGIAGAVGLTERPDPAVARAVLDALAHRGPDAEGSRWSDGTWLGFRRLSVLDLESRADQPMVDERSGLAIVFNGEIYNYVELRDELEHLGHRFLTTGDTEVVLRGFLEWGEQLFPRCNGMWAVAVDDPGRDGVLLARDRFGEKPLHLGRDRSGGWWFASEPSALLAAGVGERRLDLTRALGFLALGDVDDPLRSYFDGITQVAPGTVVPLTGRGPGPERRWFDLAAVVSDAWARPPAPDEQVLDALDRAVRLRLRSDVEVGTSLSGGVDSSTIVASLREIEPTRVLHTFTASFPGRPIDEWDRAEAVGSRFGATMHRVEPTADGLLADLDSLVHHQGAPIESPTVYAQWCVMRAALEAGVTVLLDGQAADETWGGYPKYLSTAVYGDLARARVGAAVGTVRTWRREGSHVRLDPRQPVGLLSRGRSRRLLLEAMLRPRRRLLGPALDGVAPADPLGPAASGPLLRRAAQADLGRVVLPRLLRYADRNSMAFSREVRLPFLDPEVLGLGLGSGWADGFAGGWTKRALRRAASHRLPDEIVWRRDKTAYEVPDDDWSARPDVRQRHAEAARALHAAGVVAGPEAAGLDRWRVMSLAAFVDQYGLTP